MAAGPGVSFYMLLVMMLTGGSGNHLLDYVSTEHYWKAKDVAVTVDALSAEARAAEAKDAPARVRRLMAIRALGEMKKPEALPALKPLLESKEMFVAEYAARAIASIEDKPYQPKALTREQRQEDALILPAECRLVAQRSLVGVSARPLQAMLDNLPGQIGIDKQQMLESISQTALELAEQIGDARVDSITFGLSGEIGPEAGYLVVVVRGQYDSKNIVDIAKKEEAPMEKAGDAEFVRPDDNVAMLFASDSRFILTAGPRQQQLPLGAIAKALADKKAGLAGNAEMVKLVDSVDATQPLWAAARITDSYRQAPLLNAFETITLVGKSVEGALSLEAKGSGSDAAQVATAVAEFNQGLQMAVAGAQQAAAQLPFLAPAVDFLLGVRCGADGTNATVTASLKDESVLMMPMFFFGMRAEAREVQIEPPPPMIIDE